MRSINVRGSAAALAIRVVVVGCARPGGEVIQSFLTIAGAPARSVHIEVDGSLASAGMTTELSAEYDVEGDDFTGSTSLRSGGFGGPAVETVVLDGQAWASSFDSPMQPTSRIPPSPDPFLGLTADGVEYVEPVERDGRSLHRLRVAESINALESLLAPMLLGSEMRVELLDASFEVLVDGTGTPLTATLAAQGRMLPCPPGQPCPEPPDLGLALSAEYSFSDWGADFEIQPPPASEFGPTF
jgi:hypothetical protein